ncbi:MAG: type II secretion system F family protein [Planktomarina sp.]
MSGPIIAIYVLVFFGVLVIVEGLYLLFFGKAISLDNQVNARLNDLNKTHHHEEALAQLRKTLADGKGSAAVPFHKHLSNMARRAGIQLSAVRIIMIMALLSVFVTLMVMMIGTIGVFPAAILGSAIGILAPYGWLSTAENRRLKLLEEQLPDAVELMVRSLKVGHPITATIAIVATEIADPLATEFALIADEAAYGRDLSDALLNTADRLNLSDMRFLAVAISIQQQSGGNLAEILDGLATIIRARFRLFRRIKTITAEAKWSGTFLSVFPVVGFVGLSILKPDYYAQVHADGLYGPALVVVGLFMIVNFVAMRIITNVKV